MSNGHYVEKRSSVPPGLKMYRSFRDCATRPGELKGSQSEAFFYQMVNELLECGRLPVVEKVRHASRIQDQREKVDFYLELVNGGQVPIQIKSSIRSAERYKMENPGLKAYIVVMHSKVTVSGLENILSVICRTVMRQNAEY